MLFSTSIAENIAYARPDASRLEIEAAAAAANVHDFAAALPEGYDTAVGERGMRLSGGERQRISLARAFLKDAPVLILDEPTSSVDVVTEQSIMETMRRLMSGRTIVSSSIVNFNPGAAWQIHGAADFNGDGNADIEWQNTDGTPAVWLMNGLQLLSGANVGFDPGANWHLTPGHDVLT